MEGFCQRCQNESGAQPLRDRCSLCCEQCKADNDNNNGDGDSNKAPNDNNNGDSDSNKDKTPTTECASADAMDTRWDDMKCIRKCGNSKRCSQMCHARCNNKC